MSVNRVILTGNVGQDPTLRFAKSNGQSVANFPLATHYSFTDDRGERQEQTTWTQIQVWGKRAEICKDFLKKGYHICLEGRLTNNRWTDQEGNSRERTEVVAHSWDILYRPKRNEEVEQ